MMTTATVGSQVAHAADYEWHGSGADLTTLWDHSSTPSSSGTVNLNAGSYLFKETSDNGFGTTNQFAGNLVIENGVVMTVAAGENGSTGMSMIGGIVVDGGTLVAAGNFGQSVSDSGIGIIVRNGNVDIKAGTLAIDKSFSVQIMEGGSFTLHSGAVLAPLFDPADPRNAVGKVITSTHQFDIPRTLTLEAGSILAPQLKNMVYLQPGEWRSGNIVQAQQNTTFVNNSGWEDGINVLAPSTPTLKWTITDTRSGLWIKLEREAYASGLLKGAAGVFASEIEQKLLADPAGMADSFLSDLYTNVFDAATSLSELERTGRSFSPQMATQLTSRMTTVMDSAMNVTARQTLAAGNISAKPVQIASADPTDFGGILQAQNPWSAWITPFGGFDNSRTKSSAYADTDFSYGGFSIGAARKFDNLSVGLSGFGIFGRMKSDDGGSTDTQTFGLMGHLRTAPLKTETTFAPWFAVSTGYAYTTADQSRAEIFGTRAKADINLHSARIDVRGGQDIELAPKWRLTPSVGIDYTYTHMASYTEHTGAMPMRVGSDDIHSLRPQVGIEVGYEALPGLEFSLSGRYRFETLDTDTELTYAMGGLSGLRMKGEDRGRHSGVIGIDITYQTTESLSLSGGYAATLGDRYDGHEFYVRGIYSFDSGI